MTTTVVTKFPSLVQSAAINVERRDRNLLRRPTIVCRTVAVTADRALLQAELDRELRRLLGLDVVSLRD